MGFAPYHNTETKRKAMENFDHILLFKTNINCDEDKLLMGAMLGNLPGAEKWSIDTEDEDCVLRIVSRTLRHQQIIELITNHGYRCCELT